MATQFVENLLHEHAHDKELLATVYRSDPRFQMALDRAFCKVISSRQLSGNANAPTTGSASKQNLSLAPELVLVHYTLLIQKLLPLSTVPSALYKIDLLKNYRLGISDVWIIDHATTL